MPVDPPFDPADYPDTAVQAALLTDALASRDPAFVVAAVRTVFAARGLALDVIADDPKLGVVFACLERLGVEVVAVVTTPLSRDE